MQLAVTIALSVLYVSLSLLLGGVSPRNGFPLWFFGPLGITLAGGFISERISTFLPIPWERGQRHESPPRGVHLSWRAAFRIPAYLPLYLIPYYIILILRLHFDIGFMFYIVALTVVVFALAYLVKKRIRETRLLKRGLIAIGAVESRRDTGDGLPARIYYSFITLNGISVQGRAWDLDYSIQEGSSVPIYYDANNPEDHIPATASWFEAD
ncbi:MAG: hypothetical protein EPN94_11175 [Nitrospirae bacterium]|nr:MAG: hypothetical protein EPN94_11175 [Nitrospirota bacterium]